MADPNPVITSDTFFGTTANGLKVNWSAEWPKDNSGTTALTMTFTMYLKGQMFIYQNDSNETYLGSRYYDMTALAADEEVATSDAFEMQYYLAWKNPDTSSSLTYDGVQGRVDYVATQLGGTYTRINPKARWTMTSSPTYDLKPSTIHNSADTEQDAATNVAVVGDATTEHCTEIWYLSDIATACVQFEGGLTRDRNTGDTAGDIILEYGSYDMHAMIGCTDTDCLANESFKFAEKTVDLSVLAGSGAIRTLAIFSASSAALMA